MELRALDYFFRRSSLVSQKMDPFYHPKIPEEAERKLGKGESDGGSALKARWEAQSCILSVSAESAQSPEL